MGQYYRGAILGKNRTTVLKWVWCFDFGSCSKLMEHSYLPNPYVNAFESLILKNPQHVVWAGDYASDCKNRKSSVYKRTKTINEKNKVVPTKEVTLEESRYIINHTKKLYVDKKRVPTYSDGWQIHPLPLLTCEGNGSGGGDFWGKDSFKIVGSWARDLISVDSEKPIGFREMQFNLVE